MMTKTRMNNEVRLRQRLDVPHLFEFACVVGNCWCQRTTNDLTRLWARDLKDINRLAKVNDFYRVRILGVPWGPLEGIKAQRYCTLECGKDCCEDGWVTADPDRPSFLLR
jgi:hypothetical protein